MNKMTYILIGALLFGGIIYLFAKMKKSNSDSQTEKNVTENSQKDIEILNTNADSNLSYPERLNKAKDLYPFKKWRENFFEFEMLQYTEENCNTAKDIFDNLIIKLTELGENGNKKDKETCFELAIKSLNKLNEKDEGIIETGEREDLCELIDQITLASGLNPREYAKGEGIADLWRKW